MNERSEDVLSRLMDTYGSAIQNLCAMLLGDFHIAQEAAQDTFVKAYRNLGSFRGENAGSERAWLVRIAVNTCKDYRKSAWFRLMRSRVPLETLRGVAAATDETDRDILRQVGRLPAKCREALLLYAVEEMPAEEIARLLGVTRSTVYRRLERARKLMAVRTDGKGGGGDD